MEAPTPEELREARRQSLLQRHVDGRRLTEAERREIEDLIAIAETPVKVTKSARGKAGRPTETWRWSIERICRECAVDRKTLTKRFAQDSITPGEDGMYSTADVFKGVFGDIAAEKLRKAKADATTAEVDAARAINAVMLTSDAEALWHDATARARVKIERAKYLNDQQKTALLKDLETISLTAE